MAIRFPMRDWFATKAHRERSHFLKQALANEFWSKTNHHSRLKVAYCLHDVCLISLMPKVYEDSLCPIGFGKTTTGEILALTDEEDSDVPLGGAVLRL